jgi:hypothetical protein
MSAHKPKPKRYTKAQNKELKKWEKTHPFPKQPARSGRPQPTGGGGGGGGGGHGGGGTHGKGRHGKGKHGLALPGGGLAAEPLCAATAVAVSLLLATGVAASGDDIAALHAAAGGDGEGAGLRDVLETAARRGLAGIRLASATKVTPTVDLPGGVVASVHLELAQASQGTWADEPSPLWGLHAAVLAGGHALTWGRAIPLAASFTARQVLAAWVLDWGRP